MYVVCCRGQRRSEQVRCSSGCCRGCGDPRRKSTAQGGRLPHDLQGRSWSRCDVQTPSSPPPGPIPTSRDRSIMGAPLLVHARCVGGRHFAATYRRQHLPRYEERDQRPRKGGRREDQTEPRAFEFIIPESVHRSEGDAAFANALLCAHYRSRGCSTYCTQGLRIISGAVSLRGTPGTQVLMVPRPTTTRKKLNKTSRSCFTTKLCRVTIEVSWRRRVRQTTEHSSSTGPM